MDGLEELERAAGLDPDNADYQLRQQLAEADDQLIERLVQMRKDKGLTQKVVAERMKRDVAAVSNFERLRADPHLSTIRRYAAAIGASITHGVVDVDAVADDEAGSDSALERMSQQILMSDQWKILRRPTRAGSPPSDDILRSVVKIWKTTSTPGQSPTPDEMRAIASAFLAAAENTVANNRS